ncbi:FCS-Like Zinc finger 8-like [Hibiscus syriacus]|uniref:FCS-Like Zinc finger 8-like n=1 Tax=Hibiscus syriacus TaxID=106335 RepID=UPI0019235B08|nr:FCS-Like Zinc finger 8-like [Hibiscus syriacus]
MPSESLHHLESSGGLLAIVIVIVWMGAHDSPNRGSTISDTSHPTDQHVARSSSVTREFKLSFSSSSYLFPFSFLFLVSLRKRTRAVSGKQALMADQSSKKSPAAQNYAKPIPSFFGSPRFKAFTSKAIPETEAIKSPASILDNKLLFPFCNPFALNLPKSPEVFSPENSEPKGIGLAILDTSINDNRGEDNSCRESNNKKKVLLGTELRVQIPPLPHTHFGTKTRNSSGIHTKDSPCIPVTEMELSEDYTCVISHGRNPRTTDIFDNCVVENYCSVPVPDNKVKTTSESFLSFCHTCKKNLEQKIDIYIYRGEKAFCSSECRYQEMLLDGEEFTTASRNYF